MIGSFDCSHFVWADTQRLNRCRIYLQVLHLSNIASANGTAILQCYKDGNRCPYRNSTLAWPYQPRPPESTWLLWRQTLQMFEIRSRLNMPLDPWIAASHQQWTLFVDPTNHHLYHITNSTTQIILPCVHPRTRHTRQSG